MIPADFLKKLAQGGICHIEWQFFGSGKLSAGDMGKLADAMQQNPRITDINLGDKLMGQNSIDELVRGLEENSTLRSLILPKNPIGTEGAKKLAQALQAKQDLREVDLGQCRIGDEGMAALAKALATCPNLRVISLRGNQIGEKAARAFGAMLPQLRFLERFDIRESSMKSDWLPPIAHAIPHCRSLVEFDAGDGLDMTNNGSRIVESALHAGGCPNLISSHPSSLAVGDFMKANRQRALKANEEIENCDSDFAGLSAIAIGHAADLLPAIRKSTGAAANASKAPHVGKFERYLDSLPRLSPGDAVTAASLTRKNDSGRCPLDNPRTWQQFDRMLRQADASVTPELLRQTNRDGESYLTIGLATAPDIVIPAFNARGMQLDAKLLLDGHHKPAPAMQAIMARGAAKHLFTLENWKGQSPQDMQHVFRAMPEEQQAQIKNYHSLSAALGAANGHSTARGR